MAFAEERFWQVRRMNNVGLRAGVLALLGFATPWQALGPSSSL